MKLIITPGDVVTFFARDPESPLSADPSPIGTIVQQVKRGAITVSEADSINGLAQIFCVSDSVTGGRYWYEYTDRNSKAKSFDVTQLFDSKDSQVKVRSFIET
jgi:hypothetical protein